MQTNNIIIDGTNLEFRIFYVIQKLQPTEPEQADCTFRFLYTYQKLFKTFSPQNVYASWDRKINRTSQSFRRDILGDQYKAGRTKPDNIQEMYDQEIKLIQLLECLGVKSIFPSSLEADDVCAWLSHTLEGPNVVVSADHDLFQLINETNSVYDLKTLYTPKEFTEKYGIPIEKYILYKAIKGDTSDNIDGLNGYGEIRSKKLAMNWNTTNISSEYKTLVERNIKLIDLKYGYNNQIDEKSSYENQFNYLTNIKPNFEKFEGLCSTYGYTTILKNIDEWKLLVCK